MQPTYDTRIQASTFFLDQWQGSQAPLLYTTGCAGASPCPEPTSGGIPAAGSCSGHSGVLIGQIVPNSGNLMNGIVRAGDGISKHNYTWPAVVAARASARLRRQRHAADGRARGSGCSTIGPAGDTMTRRSGIRVSTRARCATRCCSSWHRAWRFSVRPS